MTNTACTYAFCVLNRCHITYIRKVSASSQHNYDHNYLGPVHSISTPVKQLTHKTRLGSVAILL